MLISKDNKLVQVPTSDLKLYTYEIRFDPVYHLPEEELTIIQIAADSIQNAETRLGAMLGIMDISDRAKLVTVCDYDYAMQHKGKEIVALVELDYKGYYERMAFTMEEFKERFPDTQIPQPIHIHKGGCDNEATFVSDTIRPMVHISAYFDFIGGAAWTQHFTDFEWGLPQFDIDSGNLAYIDYEWMGKEMTALIKALYDSDEASSKAANPEDGTPEYKSWIEAAEALDWSVEEYDDGFCVEQGSPAGEDIAIEIGKKNPVFDIVAYAQSFDADDHAEMWVNSRGKGGAPNTIRELIDDAEAIKEMLDKLAAAVRPFASKGV